MRSDRSSSDRPLDDAAAASRLSRSNTFGLIAALGRETAGALEIVGAGTPPVQPSERRLLLRSELSERVRARPDLPFTVWDGRVRLSIAGFQDKIAVPERTRSARPLGPKVAFN